MKISLRVTTPLFALIVASLLLVGCGGSGDESAASSTASEQTASTSEAESETTMTDESDMAEENEPASMPDSDSDSHSDSQMASESAASDASDESAMSDSADTADSANDMETTDDPVTVGEDGVARLTIRTGDAIQYSLTQFTVEAGQEVELTIVHDGKLPVAAMGHNVVILPSGEDPAAFSSQASSQGGSVDNGYLPESLRDGLIAYTELIGGGESDTIRFTAPETPGDYPFLCTFPGHFTMMRGTMTVR